VRKVLLLSVLASLALCGSAISQPAPGSFFIRGSLGYATQSLGDCNDEIDLINEGVPGSSGPKDLDNFGGVIPWGIEIGYQLNPAFSLSVGVLQQRDLLENSYTIPSESLTLNSELALTAVTGAISYWIPNSGGFFFGADVGVGFGTARQDFVYRRSGTTDWSGDWSGNGLVGGAFAGYQYQSASGLLWSARTGYQLQNLGEFDGERTSSSPFGLSGSGPPLDLNGEPMETDFSGVQFLLGIGYAFGRK